jgi:hypothetical protein
VPAIADGALLHLSAIKDARAELRGAEAPLDGIVAEVNRLNAELALVKELTCLQADAMGPRVMHIMHVAEHLALNMLVMAADSRHFVGGRELQQGSAEWNSLETKLSQLKEARRELEGAVQGIYVGLNGNERDGYMVFRRELVDVNDRVTGMFGTELMLHSLLRARMEGQQGKVTQSNSGRLSLQFSANRKTEDLIKLDDADVLLLGLPQTSSASVQEWRTTVGI